MWFGSVGRVRRRRGKAREACEVDDHGLAGERCELDDRCVGDQPGEMPLRVRIVEAQFGERVAPLLAVGCL